MSTTRRDPTPAEPGGPQQPRCGRTRLNGTVCQSPVARPGAACTWHAHQTLHAAAVAPR